MRKPPGDTKGHSSLARVLIIVIGGIAGAVIGWRLGEEELSRFAARIGGPSLNADERGPVLIGYLFIGCIVGAVASSFLMGIWRRIRLRMRS